MAVIEVTAKAARMVRIAFGQLSNGNALKRDEAAFSDKQVEECLGNRFSIGETAESAKELAV